jgi:hypothetical protein
MRTLTLGILLAAALSMDGSALAAQGVPGSPLALAHGVAREGAARYRDPPVNVDGRYVVISLDEHMLYLMEDERVIWSAVVGTGTGTRLEGAGQKWDFSTPRGIFRVQLKEKDPIWRVPDWAFVERGEPIPPLDHPSRRSLECSAPRRSTSSTTSPSTVRTTRSSSASPSPTAASA